MGAVNGVLGDESSIMELPQTEVDTQVMDELRKTAKFSKTREFQELKRYIQSKIVYYQSYLPGNVLPEHVPSDERGKYWAIASIVVKELQGIINIYEQAAEDLKATAKNGNTE